MGAEYLKDQQNIGEISPRQLLHGGECNTIGVDIFTTPHKEYGRHVLPPIQVRSWIMGEIVDQIIQ